MKKQILFLIGNLKSGGAEKSLINLLQLLDYNVYDVDLVAFKENGMLLKELPEEVNLIHGVEELHYLYNDSISESLRTTNVKHIYCHLIGTAISKVVTKSGIQKEQFRWKRYYSPLIPTIKKKYDIAISYMEGSTTYYLVDKVNADRKICWIHTDYKQLNTNVNFDAEYFSKVDSVVTISEKNRTILLDIFPELNNKLYVLPNLSSSISIKRKSKEYDVPQYKKSSINLVTVGRLSPTKRIDRAICAASLLKERNIEFNWWIIGDGELRGELESLVNEKELKEEVHFLGLKQNPYPYISNASIVVQTSDFEGKSIVLDEAKILGTPIVSTNYDTVFDQVSDNEGIVVEMNPGSIADGIISLLGNEEKYRDYLRKHDYGNQNMISKYYSIFEGITDE